MPKYTVSLVRIEHRVYRLKVEAKSIEDAERKTMEAWEDDDRFSEFVDTGVVHGEEFVFEVEGAKGRVTSIG
jgi:hypothetical protein